jgi:hypothetical protein
MHGFLEPRDNSQKETLRCDMRLRLRQPVTVYRCARRGNGARA